MATKKPATTKSTKPAAKKHAPPAPGANAAGLPAPDTRTIGDRVYEVFELVLAAYASGDSLDCIGAAFEPPLSGVQVRLAVFTDKEMKKRWDAIKEHRAHGFMEVAGDQLKITGIVGMTAKERAEVAMKLAEKTAPTIFGNKIEVTGANGGALEVDVKLDPGTAYKKMLGLA